MDRDSWQRVRDIVRRKGWNSTSYQILNPGFSYWIDDVRDAVVGYVDRHGVRVVGGAPVCDDDDLADVVARFERDSMLSQRGVVYFCAEERLAELARADARRSTFPIGAQPLWRPAVLLDEFERHASLRAQLNRARNKGVRAHGLGQPTASVSLELRRCLDEWIDDRGLPPLHFLIETQTLEELQDRRVVVADRDGVPVGFLVATPIPARNGWLIEQIVRGRQAPNGTAELLLHHAARMLSDLNAGMLTLGLAPLARRGEALVDRAPRWVEGLLKVLRAHGRNFYNFEGLERFKAKFGGSHWAPVYASVAPDTRLSRALLAITAAFSGEPLRVFIPHVLGRAIVHEARRLVKA